MASSSRLGHRSCVVIIFLCFQDTGVLNADSFNCVYGIDVVVLPVGRIRHGDLV